MATALTVAVMATSVFGLSSCGQKNYAKDNETIKIGVSGPLTGGAAKYGIAVKNAAQLAVDEINAAGGLDGMMFELMATDDKHDKTNVTTTYSSMYENGMQISLGCVTTAPGLEFKELSADDNVFVLTPSATGDAIVTDYDNAFQMCFSDSNQGTASAKYFNENYSGKKVGVFYRTDDEYSTGIYEKFMAELDDSFKTDLVTSSFYGDNLEFKAMVEKFTECDVIFLPIYTQPAAAFMVAGKEKIKADAIYYGCDGLDGVEAEFGGLEEMKSSIPQEVSFLSHFNSNATDGKAAEFIEKYNDKYDESKEPLNQFGAAAYDCVYAIFEALKTAKANGKSFDTTTSASDFCDILTEVFTSDSFVFHGITGKPTSSGLSDISWSSDGYVNKEAVKYMVKEADPQ